MIRNVICTAILLALLGAAAAPCFSQVNPDLQTYFKDYIGLNDSQVSAIRSGQPVAKAVQSRIPDEVFVFGAVYVNAVPESYVQFSHDFDRLRKLPGYLAIREFSNPPQLSDLKDFSFDSQDIEALKNCKPGDCQLQMPTSSIEELHRSVDLSAPDTAEQVNQRLQKTVLERLVAYQREGNQVLGEYNDKKNPAVVPEQFKYMLSYSKALPRYLPDFYNYLLTYPKGQTANVEDTFYWAKVKFGLKPTLRVVHIVTMRGSPDNQIAYAVAEKQLYASHYFETALDLSFCVRGGDDQAKPGFYLIMIMGSEQAGLTGVKGSIVRKTAVGRSVSNLQNALTNIRNTLEANH
jgi:hypothetical protein